VRRIAWASALTLLALASYLALWPVPIRALRWAAPTAPGCVGVHAVNSGLTGLRTAVSSPTSRIRPTPAPRPPA
jgi:hypothetical protein